MTVMSDDYLSDAKNEIVSWEREGPSWLANIGSWVLMPAQIAAEALIPQGIQDAVAKAIEAFLLGISSFSNQIVDFAGIKQSVNSKVVDSDGNERDLRFLIAADSEARSCWNFHIGYAAVEGGGTGAAGLFGLAADIPALFTIVIRLIQEIGTCYGYDVTKPEEQEYVLHILRAGSSGDIKAKVEALIALKQIEEILIKVTWKKMAQELAAKRMGQMSLLAALREFAKSLGINLTKRKALQMVPIIGAIVGASFNGSYANDIGKAAYMSYRRRYIEEKFASRSINLKIINNETGKCMDICGFENHDGAKIQLWEYGGGNNQKWVFSDAKNGRSRIDSVDCNKSLDIPSHITSGYQLQIWEYWGGDNQNFCVKKNDDGSYCIYCFDTDYVLSAPEGANDNGAPLVAEKFNGSKRQEWSLTPV